MGIFFDYEIFDSVIFESILIPAGTVKGLFVRGPTIAKVLRFCFTPDPKSHQLVFNLLRIVGTVTILAALALVGYLVVAGLKRRRVGRKAA